MGSMGKYVFVFAILLVSPESLHFHGLKFSKDIFQALKIRKFVKTHNAIWTYSTTASFYVRCKVDVLMSINKTSILFRRKHYRDEQMHWAAQNIEGLFPRNQKDIMLTRPPGARFTGKETIVFAGVNYECAVIKVTPVVEGHRQYYDLRVLNASVTHRIDPRCLQKFEQLREHRRVIYGPTCQHILNIR
uniref:Lipocalin n=1 Tax=Rhipicephalus zambeziensis TaxID=60191 RepID=A0A224YN54_9ACAR